MKKLIVIFSFLLIIAVILNIYLFFKPKPIASVGGNKIYENDIQKYKIVYMELNQIDNVLEENILFELLKNHITDYCIKNLNIKIDEKNMIDIMENYKLKDLLNKKDYEKYYAMPLAKEYVLLEKILFDSVFFQSERYKTTRYILENWKQGMNINDFIKDNVEYFVYSHDEEDNEHVHSHTYTAIDPQKVIYTKDYAKPEFHEDMYAYYAVMETGDNTKGFKIDKRKYDEIIKEICNDISIKFYSAKYMRSINYISKKSFWNEIIFNE